MDDKKHYKSHIKQILFFALTILCIGGLFTNTNVSFGQPSHPIHRWALVIGIDSFPNMPGNELHYPVQDAKAFANFLRSPAGGNFDLSSVSLRVNNQANCRSIIDIFSGWLRTTALNDTIVIFWSGHGDNNKLGPGHDPQTEYSYLPAADGEFGLGGRNSVSMELLSKVIYSLLTINSSNVYIYIDACHAGALAEELDGRLSKFKYHGNEASCFLFLSCSPDEISFEPQQLVTNGHSYFTLYLLKALAGEAKPHKVGETVTFREVERYLVDSLENFHQKPIIKNNCPSDDCDKTTLSVVSYPTFLETAIPAATLSFNSKGRLTQYPSRKINSSYSDSILRERINHRDLSFDSNSLVWNLWQRLKSDSSAVNELKNKLAFWYVDNSEILMDDFFKGENKINVSPEIFKNASLGLDHAVELLGDEYLLNQSLIEKSQLLLGLSLMKNSNPHYVDSAYRLFQNILVRNPSSSYAYYGMALIDYFKGKYSESIENNIRALRLSPRLHVCLENIARVYMQQGRFALAYKLIDSLIRLDTSSSIRIGLLGEYYSYYCDRYAYSPLLTNAYLDSSQKWYKKALMHSKSASITQTLFLSLVTAWYQAGRDSMILDSISQYETLYPDEPAFSEFHAKALFMTSQYDSCLSFLKHISYKFPSNINLIGQTISCYLQKFHNELDENIKQKLLDSAESLSEKTIKIDSSTFNNWAFLIQILFEKQNHSDTVRAFEIAYKIAILSWGSDKEMLTAARFYENLNLQQMAIKILMQGLTHENVSILTGIARLYRQLGEESSNQINLSHSAQDYENEAHFLQVQDKPIPRQKKLVHIPFIAYSSDLLLKRQKLQELILDGHYLEMLQLYGVLMANNTNPELLEQLISDIEGNYWNSNFHIFKLANSAEAVRHDDIAEILLKRISTNDVESNVQKLMNLADFYYHSNFATQSLFFCDSLLRNIDPSTYKSFLGIGKLKFIHELDQIDLFDYENAKAYLYAWRAKPIKEAASLDETNNMSIIQMLIYYAQGKTDSALFSLQDFIQNDHSWHHYGLYESTSLHWGYSTNCARLLEEIATIWTKNNANNPIGSLSVLNESQYQTFHNFGSLGLQIYNLIDGKRSLDEIRHMTNTTEEQYDEVIRGLNYLGLIDANAPLAFR